MLPAMHQQGQMQADVQCSPMQVAFAEMLALDTAAFEDSVATEVDANPALERLAAACSICGGVVGGPCCRRPRTYREDGVLGDGVARLSAPVTARDALLREIAPMVSTADRWVAEYLVGSLDNRGLLDGTAGEIATRIGVPRHRVNRVLAALRSVTCAGAGASTLREHLVLELGALEPGPLVDLARAAVERDFAALARGETSALAKMLATDREAIGKVRDFIRTRLHPYPLVGDMEAANDAGRGTALPDVAMRATEDGDGVTVRVVEADRVQLRVNTAITPLGDGGWAEEAVASARSFLDRVRRRWETIQAVAGVVAHRQKEFILDRSATLQPLTRAAVALELGVHESTVGRVVKNRYVLVPSGSVVAFSTFFRPVPDAREALRGIVAGEERPLTDTELASELNRRGHQVARRTVVKYRHQLGIASALQRG